MDYKKTALAILDAVGGKENIVSAAHCATRLRLVIADNARCDKKTVENIDGVKGAFEASGQLQIIIGTGAVNKVYDEFVAAAGIAAASKEEVKQAAAAKAPWYKRAIKTLGDVFVPIIPAIVASGLLMGLLEGFANVFPGLTETAPTPSSTCSATQRSYFCPSSSAPAPPRYSAATSTWARSSA